MSDSLGDRTGEPDAEDKGVRWVPGRGSCRARDRPSGLVEGEGLGTDRPLPKQSRHQSRSELVPGSGPADLLVARKPRRRAGLGDGTALMSLQATTGPVLRSAYFSCTTSAMFQLNRTVFINNFQSKKNGQMLGL